MGENENVLDAADKNTGPRTCPECGYQFSLALFVKRYVMKHGYPKWTCPSCNKFIKYNYSKANLIGTIVFFACVFLFYILRSKLELDLPNFMFLVLYFFFALLLLNFDRFEKYEK